MALAVAPKRGTTESSDIRPFPYWHFGHDCAFSLIVNAGMLRATLVPIFGRRELCDFHFIQSIY